MVLVLVLILEAQLRRMVAGRVVVTVSKAYSDAPGRGVLRAHLRDKPRIARRQPVLVPRPAHIVDREVVKRVAAVDIVMNKRRCSAGGLFNVGLNKKERRAAGHGDSEVVEVEEILLSGV